MGGTKLPTRCCLFLLRLRRLRVPALVISIKISIRCDLRSVPGPGRGRHHGTGKSASMPASTLHWKPITSNFFPETYIKYLRGELAFPDQPRRVLLCIAHDPGVRLRDVAARQDITERSAHGIITALTAAGYLVSRRTAAVTATRSRRTCPCPNRQPGTHVGEVLALLTGNDRTGIQNS